MRIAGRRESREISVNCSNKWRAFRSAKCHPLVPAAPASGFPRLGPPRTLHPQVACGKDTWIGLRLIDSFSGQSAFFNLQQVLGSHFLSPHQK